MDTDTFSQGIEQAQEKFPEIKHDINLESQIVKDVNLGASDFETDINLIFKNAGYTRYKDVKYLFDSGGSDDRVIFIKDKNNSKNVIGQDCGLLIKYVKESTGYEGYLFMPVSGNLNKITPEKGAYILDHFANTQRLPYSGLKTPPENASPEKTRVIETARKTGYVQGVCECVAAIGDDHTLGKKLLTEMNVNKDMAQKFANPETFKLLEQGIFAQKHEQNLEQTQSFKR